MVKWINHVAIAAPRNGTTSHTVDPSTGTVVTGALFTPTAGNFLVCLSGGSVTSTTPSGWTLPTNGNVVANGGLYIWYKTAAGADTLTTTHNGSNYPCIFDIYEFPAGATFLAAALGINVSASGGAGPSLSGLTSSSNLRVAAVNQARTSATTGTVTWSNGTEAADTSVGQGGAPSTDGYVYSLTYQEDQVGATYSSAATLTTTTPACERLVVAFNVPASGITGTLSASTPSVTVELPTTSISGTVAVPTYAGDVVASTPAITAGAPTASISGAVTVPTWTGDLTASTPEITASPPSTAITGVVAPPEFAGTLDVITPSLTVGPSTSIISGTFTAPGGEGTLTADTPTVTAGPPTIAMSGTITAPVYAGDLAASTAALTVGPSTAAISGTFTAPGANQVVASTPTVVIGPPTSSIAGTAAPPVYAGTIDATAPVVVVGPAELAMSGTIAMPVYSGTLVASAPTTTVGPPTAQIFDSSIPPLPTSGVSLTVDTGTRGLTLTAEARSLEVTT